MSILKNFCAQSRILKQRDVNAFKDYFWHFDLLKQAKVRLFHKLTKSDILKYKSL